MNRLRVGITGQEGFVGTHLYNALSHNESVSLVDYDITKFKDPQALEDFVSSCDVLVHLAAMNRGEPHEIKETNIDLVNQLVRACEKTDSKPKIIFSSSTQEEQDNLYGESKIEGRRLLQEWAEESKGALTSFIIPNVFGPHGKPYYNSFIATFSHQLIQGEEPKVINDSQVGLIYVGDLVKIIISEILVSAVPGEVKKIAVQPTTDRKVSEVLNQLKTYKELYFDKGIIPNVPLGSFELDLFHSFVSFIPTDYFPRPHTQHSDERGAFVETLRAGISGQSSFSTTVQGITRGNHYHTRKIERFSVIKGKALIRLRKVNTSEVYEYIIDEDKPSYVDMPIWYTHNITNIGERELITIFWINEPYAQEDPDTFFDEV